MLPNTTRNGGAFLFTYEVITITMHDTQWWDALQTYLTQSINEGYERSRLPSVFITGYSCY